MYSKAPGGISWIDLTIDNATEIKDFYAKVVGLDAMGQSMADGEYEDYVMTTSEDPEFAVGICHAKGPNQELPPQWLMYFNVSDVEQALQECVKMGGTVIKPMTDMGSFEMGVIKDPAGAVAGVIKAKAET